MCALTAGTPHATSLGMNAQAHYEMTEGYCYELAGRTWRTADDDDWEVTLSEPTGRERLLGFREIRRRALRGLPLQRRSPPRPGAGGVLGGLTPRRGADAANVRAPSPVTQREPA